MSNSHVKICAESLHNSVLNMKVLSDTVTSELYSILQNCSKFLLDFYFVDFEVC